MEKPKKATIKKNDPAQEAAAAKLNALSQAMEKIAKNFGRGAIMKLGDDNVEDVEVIPTGSIGLNFALGVGGFPQRVWKGGGHVAQTAGFDKRRGLTGG